MDKNKQRIKIAEVCGWTEITHIYDGKTPDGKYFTLLPDYLNDLDAMHDAWRTLSVRQKTQFVIILSDLMLDCQSMDFSKNPFTCSCLANANAEQRAEAFLRTLNLWENPV